MDYRRKVGTLIPTSLLEDLVKVAVFSSISYFPEAVLWAEPHQRGFLESP